MARLFYWLNTTDDKLSRDNVRIVTDIAVSSCKHKTGYDGMVLSRIPGKIHHHLRTLRTERGLTLKQVSEGTGLAVSTLHAIEKGRPATLITAFKLARFYGLPVENIWQPFFQQICQEADESGRDCEAYSRFGRLAHKKSSACGKRPPVRLE